MVLELLVPALGVPLVADELLLDEDGDVEPVEPALLLLAALVPAAEPLLGLPVTRTSCPTCLLRSSLVFSFTRSPLAGCRK